MTQLRTWERGLAVAAASAPEMSVYLWCYEWNMFEAMAPGQHSNGRWDWPSAVDAGGRRAHLGGAGLQLEIDARDDGAELRLTVRNETDYVWPPVAGLIPCFNPGDPKGRRTPLNERLLDPEHVRTWFVGPEGLERLVRREIHFNAGLRSEVLRQAVDGRFVFSEKWPTSERPAAMGLLLREASGGGWIAGIGWDAFLSAQGHNPWNCMHLGVLAGALKPGEARTVRGRIFLFEGTKEEALGRYREFLAAGAGK